MPDYNYEYAGHDFGYEISGTTGQEFEHKEGCDWVYDNCTCGMAEKLHTLMDKESEDYEYEEW